MSLHHLARQVQSQGRGDDKMLVHMTPGEVKGLQALALAHGGSLSINPSTGLPEAGFLKNILPTVVGAGAMFIPGMQPIGAAMLGAGVGLATSGGNLKQGILGGLGAWGGASLVGGMMGTGAAALGGSVGAAESAALLGDAAIASGAPTAGMVGAANTGLPIGTQTLGGTVTAGGLGGGSAVGAATPSAAASIQEGFKQAAANPGAYFKQNMFPIGAAVAPVLLGDSGQQTGISATQDQGQIRPYTYSQTRNPNAGLPGEAYFNQSYTAGTPYAAAGGGLVALASGGEVKNTGVDPIALAPATNKYGAPRTVSPAVTEYNRILMDRAANEYITQPPPLATLPGRGERANAADTQKIINEMYLSQLGRQGDQAGLEYWANQKAQTGMSLADVKKTIGSSPEGQIFGLYKDVLGRRPDEAGAEYWQSQIAAGVPIADIRKQFETSAEARANKPVYFDPEFYAKANPDIARVSEYAADPFLHYQRHGFQEGRAGAEGYTGKDMLGLAPKAPAGSQTGGFKYDAALQRFTGGLPQPQQDTSGFLSTIANDPGFQSWAQQNLYNQYLQSQQPQYATGGITQLAKGGIADLGGYSDGGRMLKGPGDGMSDSIPGVIGGRQPARLADGEFVVPADVVSHIGNGSTDAGAKKLYAMMDRVRKARTGKKKQAPQVKTERFLPA